MSVDKLVDSTQLDADLTSVANAIRTKGGTSAQLAFPADFVSAIAAIPSGGSNVQSGTVIGNGRRDITIAVTGTVSKFVIYSSDYSGGSNYQNATLTAVSGWGFWGLALNGTTPSRLLYSLESGYTAQKYVTFSNGSVKLAPYYIGSGYQVWGTGITYQWYAW